MGTSLGMVGWYRAITVLWAALLLLCLSGWRRGLSGFAKLLEQWQHWAIPTWKVRTEHNGAVYPVCARWIAAIGLVASSLTSFLASWSCSVSCTRATAVSVCGLTCSSSCKGLASPSLPPAPLLSNDNLNWWAKRASQNPVDLPMCPFLRVAASVLAVGPSHSTDKHGIQPLARKNSKRKYSFYCQSGLILFQSQVSTSLKS